jgi:hypothetical protein
LLEPCAGITRQHGSEGAGPQQCGPATRLVSPLLANVYLHRLDRAWDTRAHGVLVRFADDVVVMCVSRAQAEAALVRLTDLLAELGLEPKAAKTRIVQLVVDGGKSSGFDFLGFHHRLVRSDGRRTGKHVTFLARWPRTRPCSTPATGFGNSPTGACCCYPSKRS